MKIVDRAGILPEIERMDYVAIELGCGSTKQIKHAIGIDQFNLDGVDIVCNLEEGLPFLQDNCVDVIYSFHLLEHLTDVGTFMAEIFRVLKPGGRKIGTVPHFSNPYYYSDYTHRTPFGLYSFCYFSSQTPYRRKVLHYQKDIEFRIVRQEIIFYSPFKFINLFRKFYGFIINSSGIMQELYEGSLSGILPAHELSFELEKP